MHVFSLRSPLNGGQRSESATEKASLEQLGNCHCEAYNILKVETRQMDIHQKLLALLIYAAFLHRKPFIVNEMADGEMTATRTVNSSVRTGVD